MSEAASELDDVISHAGSDMSGSGDTPTPESNEEAEEAEITSSSASDKRAKFKELASKRVTNILNCYRILGNLANPSTYPYTQEDVDKIFARLEGDLAELKEEFQPKKPKDTTFVL